MNYDVFPYVHSKSVREAADQKVLQAKREAEYNVEQIRSAAKNEESELRQSKHHNDPPYLRTAGGGGVIGLIIGIFVCFSYGDQIDSQIHFSDSLGSGFGFWFIFGIAGAVLALIFCALIGVVQKTANSQIDVQIAAVKKQADKKVAAEMADCDKTIERIRNEATERCLAYLDGFNAAAQQLSVRFVESPLATEVIEWMTAGFERAINAADRRSHIQEINVPFAFKVYKNKIDCVLGSYDFEIKRCDELASPLEQTALASAIASAIQLNITMKYPKDASGTNIVTNIAYNYYEDHIAATIVYTAPNGNYQATRGWTTT